MYPLDFSVRVCGAIRSGISVEVKILTLDFRICMAKERVGRTTDKVSLPRRNVRGSR